MLNGNSFTSLVWTYTFCYIAHCLLVGTYKLYVAVSESLTEKIGGKEFPDYNPEQNSYNVSYAMKPMVQLLRFLLFQEKGNGVNFTIISI